MIAMYASEAREDFELAPSETVVLGIRCISAPPRNHWFFLLQSMLAVSHLTDCQHCDVETISYAGVVNNKHVWVGRA